MDTQYFIKKFEAIPEERWSEGQILDHEGRSCANGLCGVVHLGNIGIMYGHIPIVAIHYQTTRESRALQELFSKLEINCIEGVSYETFYEDFFKYSVTAAIINNGHAVEYPQETPKQRILAALKDIQLLEAQDKAVEQVQSIVAEEKIPDDVDTSVNMPNPRPKNKLVSALAFAWIFILNIT